jgi:hypothetical protein
MEQNPPKPHPVYRGMKCHYSTVSSFTKMRDNKYFVSTTDQKYWFLDDSQTANEDNSRQLTTITRDWSGIDASFFYGYRVECEPKYKDKLFLISFNFKTNTNEILIGSLTDWNWTFLAWDQFPAFKLSETHINWNKSIDAIVAQRDSIYIFQGFHPFYNHLLFSKLFFYFNR